AVKGSSAYSGAGSVAGVRTDGRTRRPASPQGCLVFALSAAAPAWERGRPRPQWLSGGDARAPRGGPARKLNSPGPARRRESVAAGVSEGSEWDSRQGEREGRTRRERL